MSRIAERYSTAIMTSNLKSELRSDYSDSDVVGAYGFASKENPLGVALARLLAGGRPATAIEALAYLAMERARDREKRPISKEYALLIAQEVIAWYQHSVCTECNGLGSLVIEGTTTLKYTCVACDGTGRVDLFESIPKKRHELARWLSSQMDISLAGIGGQAMRRLIAPPQE
jgi:hypothetical protein